jgi:hypothetical protein
MIYSRTSEFVIRIIVRYLNFNCGRALVSASGDRSDERHDFRGSPIPTFSEREKVGDGGFLFVQDALPIVRGHSFCESQAAVFQTINTFNADRRAIGSRIRFDYRKARL